MLSINPKHPYLCLCVGLLLFLAGCSQLTVQLPAIGHNHQYRPGQVVWRDLLTRKPDAVKHFYHQLFGWQFTPVRGALGDSGYELIEYQGQAIGGLVDTRTFKAKDNLSQWINVFSTRDIKAASEQLQALDGTLVGGPKSVGERGSLALAQDPEGAHFALLQTTSGDAPATPQAPGFFLWTELWNQSGQSEFYEQLLSAQPAEANLNGQVFHYHKINNQPAFAILKSPLPGLHPTWVSYIQVDDVAAKVAQVEALGGQVLVPPQANPAGGELAVIADPSGAGFIIQTWQRKQLQNAEAK